MNAVRVRHFKRLSAFAVIILTAASGTSAQQADPNFAAGGKGIRLAVLEPAGKGLADDDKWMLSLVQGSIAGDFNKYSGMTIIDRQNIEKVMGEWETSMSGHYSDADRVKIGNLTNASHILTGSISKTASSYIIEFSVTDLQSGERKASYSPKPVSLLALEDLSAIKEVTADLLTQLGVKLSGSDLMQLRRSENTAKIAAETALARGIRAQKQGTEVAALSYFFQAANLDPSLAEAVNRSSVMAANVSSGNIGEDARNDITWRKSWVKRLEEAERSIDNINKTVSMPYTLFYSDEIIKGDINYQNETMSLTIKTNLYGSGSIRAWARSVEQALQAVYDGLEATGRKEVWGLRWPNNSVTNLNSFRRQSRTFTIVAELVNSQNRIIGRQELKVAGYWDYETYRRPGVSISADSRKDVRFTNVRADDITDNLTIRFASVNGEDAAAAARKGVLQIKAMRKSDFDDNDRFTFAFGEIKKYKGGGEALVIPNTIWDEAVTSIGSEAFAYNNLTKITIGANVTLGQRAFDNGFVEFYQQYGRKAGMYTYQGYQGNYNWRRQVIDAERVKQAAERAEQAKQAIEQLGQNFVSVQGGTFTMGCMPKRDNDCESNEKPAHSVTVGNFKISKYEVTQKLWELVMGDNPSDFKGDNFPVEQVSWDDVQIFISTLNATTGKKYRLPTEAEWEYAARGGNKSKGYKYSGSNNIDEVAWYGNNSGSKTHQVGTKQANELGIYDMTGNVWEWVSDWYGKYSSGAQTNPTGTASGSSRVIRGGSWNGDAQFCRVSFRGSFYPDDGSSYLGFRLVLSS